MRSEILSTLILSTGLFFFACAKEEAKQEIPASAKADPTKAVPSKVEQVDPAAPVVAVMKPYEECRALLAADKGEGIALCAKAMTEAAKSGAKDAAAAAKAHMEAVSIAADALAEVAKDDMAKLRLAFGEVSKSVVELLKAVPEAAKDYHLFECPMADGYQKWAQPNEELANPYMGSKMLSCGSEIHDHHQGMGGEGHMKGGHEAKPE